MSNIIISLTIAVMSLHFFTVTYRLNGINRSLYNTPISIFESSIPLLQDTESFEPYYDKDKLEEKLTYYLDNSISRYCHSYSVEFYYYYQEDDSICLSAHCNAIEINLSADVILLTKYHRTARFFITHN